MNQHFVPRVYLKKFAAKRGKEYFVDVFDKAENRYFNANIRKVCAEIDLYTLEPSATGDKDVLAIENLYANHIEPLYLKIYDTLVNDEVFTVSDSERKEIVLGILHFHMRNPRVLKRAIAHHRIEIAELCTEARAKKGKGITYFEEDFSFREWSEDSITNYFAEKTATAFKEKHILVTKQIISFHELAKIEIKIARGDSKFLTSDNPLVTEDFITKYENPLSKSTEFIFTLNQKYAVRLYHDNTRELNTIRRGFIPNGSVNNINEKIFAQSARFLFGDKQSFKEYFHLQAFMQNDSLELKMDMIKQILDLRPDNEYSKASHSTLQEYYEKYMREGTIDIEEEQRVYNKIRQIAIEFKNKNIQ
ncbi:MAG: hypothetical protein JWR44_1107 [Hymenobacter sp.]|jgi:hypothetical protein|nr:hypothetical protein [Hymenobacter sp.]